LDHAYRMSLTVDQKTNADGFPKPGELIEITNTSALEASDRAVINLLYQHAHDSGRLSEPNALFEVSITDLLPSSHTSTDRLRDTLGRLLDIQIRVKIPHPKTGQPALLLTPLFAGFIIPEKSAPNTPAKVSYRVPIDLLPVLLKSNRWGRIKAEIVCSMSSKYAIALYELLKLRANMERCVEVFPVIHFRELLGVPEGTYQRTNNFIQKVLTPAALEVNALADIGVKIEVNRRSPYAPIESVTVAWWKKSGDDYREAMRERERSKLGRKARLRGSVEPVATQVNTRLTEALAGP
jgi:hypothetical protein